MPIHPLLLGLVPLLSQLTYNWAIVGFDQVLRIALVITLATAVFYAFLARILSDIKFAAVLVSVCSLLFFTYGHLHTLILVAFTFLPFNWEYLI
ncbi:MAG: hypothetical protein ACLFWD_03900, partial [Anaerolineales bacterium]